jgi:hypothetical protein
VPYAPDARRWFFYRKAGELTGQLRGAGLRVETITEEITSRHWLNILAGGQVKSSRCRPFRAPATPLVISRIFGPNG